MTDLRTAAQQVLEALKGYRRELGDQQPCDAEQALEAALAEPVEPVAHKHEWFSTGAMKPGQMRCIHCGVWNHEIPPQRPAEPVQEPQGCDHCNHPLYAATKCRVCGRVTEVVQEPRTIRMERVDRSTSQHWWSEAARIRMPSPELYAAGDTVLCWVNEGDMVRAAQPKAEPVQAEPDSPERRCGGPGCDMRCCQPVQEPVARVRVNSNVPGRINELDLLRPLPRGEHFLYTPPPQRPAEPQGCAHCNHPLYAAIKCRVCGRAHGIGGEE